MNNTKLNFQNIGLQALIFILVQGILAFYLGQAFWNPGKYVYTFGGDGSFIYYNMIFHTFFGDGMILKNMNYPRFESIFMTDAQASLSILFSWIHDIFPNYFTPNKIVGWSHRFHYIMFGLASIYIYKTLDLFSVKKHISIPASIFIVLLSPMMIRLNAGHFGLAFPFVFAYTFFFLCQFLTREKIKLFNVIAFVFVLLFFGLNNFYVGMINLTFMLLVGIMSCFLPNMRKKGYTLLGIVIPLIIILYLFIQLTDPGANRIEIQWGYFSNRANIASFLFPPTGTLSEISNSLNQHIARGFETWIYLGLMPILALLILSFFFFKKKIQFHSTTRIFTFFAIAGLIMFVYGSALLYHIPCLREHFFLKISLLTMFKASARFAWPVYFISTLLSMIMLDRWIKQMHSRSSITAILLSVVFLVWGIETHRYLDQHVFTQMYGNPYSQETKQKMLNLVDDANINLDEFQAIYSLPVMEGWNDKFHIVPHFNAEFNSILFSMSTGLPMINAMLSRIGITDATNAIQLSADPLIQRNLIKDLNLDQDIMVIFGKDPENLTAGEQFLLDTSELLADEESFQLRRLSVKDLDRSMYQDSLISQYRAYEQTAFDTDTAFYHIENFDAESGEFAFAGGGSRKVEEEGLLISTQLPDTLSGNYESSIWVKLDNHMYGMPIFRFEFLDQNQNVIESGKFDAYKTRDVQDLWVRASKIWNIPSETRSMNVYVEEINQTFHVDEWTFRALDSELIRKSTDEFLFNNYRLK